MLIRLFKLSNVYFIQSAEQLYQVMTRKFSQNREIWLGYGMFCFRNEKSEVGRQLLQRSLKSLPIKDREYFQGHLVTFY